MIFRVWLEDGYQEGLETPAARDVVGGPAVGVFLPLAQQILLALFGEESNLPELSPTSSLKVWSKQFARVLKYFPRVYSKGAMALISLIEPLGWPADPNAKEAEEALKGFVRDIPIERLFLHAEGRKWEFHTPLEVENLEENFRSLSEAGVEKAIVSSRGLSTMTLWDTRFLLGSSSGVRAERLIIQSIQNQTDTYFRKYYKKALEEMVLATSKRWADSMRHAVVKAEGAPAIAKLKSIVNRDGGEVFTLDNFTVELRSRPGAEAPEAEAPEGLE